jgi:hypothetical protein
MQPVRAGLISPQSLLIDCSDLCGVRDGLIYFGEPTTILLREPTVYRGLQAHRWCHPISSLDESLGRQYLKQWDPKSGNGASHLQGGFTKTDHTAQAEVVFFYQPGCEAPPARL